MLCFVPHSSLIISSRSAPLFFNTLPDHCRYVGGLRGPALSESGSCVVGFSSGLLAAAAVALSPAVSALIPLAVEAVRIAFRLGLHIERTARNIENLQTNEESIWSYVITGKTEEEARNALSVFHDEKVSSLLLNLIFLTDLLDYTSVQSCLHQCL